MGLCLCSFRAVLEAVLVMIATAIAVTPPIFMVHNCSLMRRAEPQVSDAARRRLQRVVAPESKAFTASYSVSGAMSAPFGQAKAHVDNH
jgi:hypothetical protein